MAKPIKIKFFAEAEWPADLKKRKGEAALTGIVYEREEYMPFLPRRGDHLLLNAADDYREVDSVYVNVADARYEVYFAGLADMKHADMLKAGWKEQR